jgi:DNA-binding transcriptional regulator YiaG
MGRQMSERAEFHVMGQPYDGAPLHYTASGLDYVYLVNGFSVENDPDYGRIVTIDAPDDLHKAIGLHIVTKKNPLTGAEFRFLRKQMKLTQKELAVDKFGGADVQTIANYEKGKKIPPASDQLMRMTFALWLIPADARAAVVKEIAEEMQKRKRQRPSKTVNERSSYRQIVRRWHPSAMPCVAH